MAFTDDKMIITPEDAEGLLPEGDTVHNFIQSGNTFLGCDFGRDAAVKAFKNASLIEIGGPACKRMRHPIVVWEPDNRYSFFEADMAKVEALEASRLPAS